MKATATAPSNIAFIKYWGKANDTLRIPLNASISMNLDQAYTVTTVEFSVARRSDEVELSGGTFSDAEVRRVIDGLTRIRRYAGRNEYAKVVTKNTFPKGAGSAASASGFAALTMAGFAALGVTVPERELTVVARMGSGSACRSIPDGFVEWTAGGVSEDSYAVSLYPPEYWDLRDILVIVDSGMKKIPTTEGMGSISTSPLLSARLTAIPGRIARCKAALAARDLCALGEVIEEDCLDMHAVMQSQVPPLYYWTEATKVLMREVPKWRASGIAVYMTIDAGPNVHLICERKDADRVVGVLRHMSGIERVIVNAPSVGARVIDQHLF